MYRGFRNIFNLASVYCIGSPGTSKFDDLLQCSRVQRTFDPDGSSMYSNSSNIQALSTVRCARFSRTFKIEENTLNSINFQKPYEFLSSLVVSESSKMVWNIGLPTSRATFSIFPKDEDFDITQCSTRFQKIRTATSCLFPVVPDRLEQ
jgi:hypothetical protein